MTLIKLLIVTILTFASAAGTTAQAPVYRFRPERVPVGTVFHYLKTNVDGTKPENVSLYIASADRIESFKYHEKGTRAGLVTAELDWENFIAKKLESYQVFGANDIRLFATLKYEHAKKQIIVSIPAARPGPETVEVGRLPFHLFNFDLASLNLSFAQLADPRKPFTVGIADPAFKNDGPLMAYKGDLNVKYDGDEVRGKVKCRRYLASGPGIGGKGTIWVSMDHMMIEDMEFDVPNNPDWTSFKLKLVKAEKLSPDGWKRLISSHF